MKVFADFINCYKKLIIAVFMLASFLCILLFLLTPVNYNMMDYLPEDANSTKALTIMQDEFDQPLPNLNVMVKNISLMQAVDIKEKIAKAEHVKEVL